MTDLAAGVVKTFVPGSINFLAAGLLASLLLCRFGLRAGLAAGATLLLAYGGLSLPWTARQLASPLVRHPPLAASPAAVGVWTLIVLDGDHPHGRIREAMRLWRTLEPRLVVVSGRPWFHRALVQAGIPPDRLLWDSRSATTYEQARHVGRLLHERRTGRALVVASPLHMRRVLAAFDAARLDVVPAVSGLPYGHLPRGAAALVPHPAALRLSTEALYELLALQYYRLRGWVAG
jgi:uncharacterized SAM-binding protein YcdF (DUF218 family)